jgi:LPXTG-motif cell wall-anchored protein
MRKRLLAGLAAGVAVFAVAGGEASGQQPPVVDVTVEPASGLTDGAVVIVTATGLPQGTWGVGQCLMPCSEANGGNFSTTRVAADGNLRAEKAVLANLTNDTGLNADCTTQPCAIFITNLGGAGETGEEPISFGAAAPAAPLPTTGPSRTTVMTALAAALVAIGAVLVFRTRPSLK